MSRNEQFRIEEFVIHVDEGTYLVEVYRNDDEYPLQSIEDLPNWVFASRYAIWLSGGDAPVRERALEGERIKQDLMKRIQVY
jgi:hypothetical protein